MIKQFLITYQITKSEDRPTNRAVPGRAGKDKFVPTYKTFSITTMHNTVYQGHLVNWIRERNSLKHKVVLLNAIEISEEDYRIMINNTRFMEDDYNLRSTNA